MPFRIFRVISRVFASLALVMSRIYTVKIILEVPNVDVVLCLNFFVHYFILILKSCAQILLIFFNVNTLIKSFEYHAAVLPLILSNVNMLRPIAQLLTTNCNFAIIFIYLPYFPVLFHVHSSYVLLTFK